MSKHTDPQPTYSERIVFPDGDHVTLTVEDPNYVEVRGCIADDTFHVSLRSDVADTEADLLLNGSSPDALWNLPQAQARRFGNAMVGAAVAARLAEVPEADSPEDLPARASRGNAGADAADILEAERGDGSKRVGLDGGHADLEVIGQHVELTVTLNGRATIGLALSAAEARRIGDALTAAAHCAHTVQAAQIDLEGVRTVTDLWNRAQETGVPAAALVEVIDR